jgi:hypothetical protein
MKVFILVGLYDYEPSTVLSAYSNKRAANSDDMDASILGWNTNKNQPAYEDDTEDTITRYDSYEVIELTVKQ